MINFLYERFLEDKRVYLAARAFWFRQIKNLFPNRYKPYSFEPFPSYLSERFVNGELFYDGNPIINFVNLKTGKAIRVVQESPIRFENFYTSWDQPIMIDQGRKIQEKVIVLTLSRESLERSKTEIREWLHG